MRILIVSNFYPPSRSWGYTQLCHEVSQQLVERGHTLAVLTSNYPVAGKLANPVPVFRLLHLESDPLYYRPASFFTSRRKLQKQNRLALLEVAAQFRPDVVFIWGMWNMSADVAAVAEGLDGVKVVYYVSDHWPALDTPHDVYWRLPARRWYLKPVKAVANRLALGLLARDGKPPALKFEHAICVSETLRQSLVEKGTPLQDATVIYNGIDVAAFSHSERPRNGHSQDETLRLLYAGRLSFDKGVHTAVAALARLVHDEGIENVSLAIAGDGPPDYLQRLHQLVARHNLGEHVTFHGLVARAHMPQLLNHCDVLIFPSIAVEALPRMPQEAMACGLVVVGTTTGGTKELLLDGENGLTFPPEDDEALAAQLLRLAVDPELRRRLAQNGRRTVLEKFTVDRMVDEIESYLQKQSGTACRPEVESLP
jgi:glycosyltransferase involved in cell wall biosynthesis